jgi:hypothetical protein
VARGPVPYASAVCPIIGLCVSFVAFYPGFLSPDSLSQYQEALRDSYTDWHPPVMAWVWNKLNFVSDAPQNMLFFHLAMFWTGLGLLQHAYSKSAPFSSALFPLIGFLPWIVNFEGLLWKDVGMAASWLLFVAVLMVPVENGRVSRTRLVIASVVFMYGFLVRTNAVFGALPLLYFLVRVALPNANKATAALVACALLCASLASAWIFNHKIARAERTNIHLYMMLDDLHHISIATNRSRMPPETHLDDALLEKCRLAPISAYFCYRENGWTTPVNTQDIDDAITRAWVDAVSNNTLMYLRYRIRAYFYFLRSPRLAPQYYWHNGIPANEFGFKHEGNRVTRSIESMVHFTARRAEFLFKPYFWLSSAVLMLLSSLWMKGGVGLLLARCLLASAVLYVGAYLPITPAYDLRFAYWSIVATCVALAVIFVDKTITGPHRRLTSIRLASVLRLRSPESLSRRAVAG